MATTSIADKPAKLEKKIAKREDSKPDTETESIKTEIIRIDSEILKLMEKLADASGVPLAKTKPLPPVISSRYFGQHRTMPPINSHKSS